MSEAPRSASSDDTASEIRALLADTVGRLFGEEVTRERIVAAESGEWLTGLWEAVEAAGLLRAHLPESAGGAGAGWREAFVVAHAAGRHCVPLPVAETLLAGWLLTRAGLAVPAGPLAVAPRPLPSTALRSGRIEATLGRVPWGRHASNAVVVVPTGTGVTIAIIPLGGAEVRPGRNLALEPRDDLRVAVTPSAEGRTELPATVLGSLGAMMRAAQMAGALEAILDLAVAYANERVQFGRPIGKFQIIQQELARLASHVAAAGTAAELAFRAVDEAGSFGRSGARETRPSRSPARGRRRRAAEAGPHRSSSPRRDRLHLRALAPLRDAPALGLAERVQTGEEWAERLGNVS
jgi:acyl-CoA dehydrogenase